MQHKYIIQGIVVQEVAADRIQRLSLGQQSMDSGTDQAVVLDCVGQW